MINVELLRQAKELLRRHEGFRSRPYRCPAGRLTIGYGHNLDANGISKGAAEYILGDDIQIAYQGALRVFGFDAFESFGTVRQAAFIDMLFMGEARFKGFKNMIAAALAGDWERASAESLRSKWAFDVDDGPGGEFGRADRVAYMLRHNEYPV